jgi:8-oxo-dGTP pyrophosphatase MutT (NUDIX family)
MKRTQYGALCWRSHRGSPQVLLVTSRDTGRWVIPKGWPGEGLDPVASAEREAWEEAGVEGAVNPSCLGYFSYDKIMTAHASLPCVVGVYGLRVHRLQRRFPERTERRRKWFSLDKAAKKVAEAELRTLILSMKSVLLMPDEATTKDGKVVPTGNRA